MTERRLKAVEKDEETLEQSRTDAVSETSAVQLTNPVSQTKKNAGNGTELNWVAKAPMTEVQSPDGEVVAKI